jgi:hypothetical protein
MCFRSKPFPVENLVLQKYDPWECKECTHVHSSSMICVNKGGGGWLKVSSVKY